MLPANLISALQVLSRSAKPQVTAGTETPNAAAKLEPNQQLQGTIQSQVSAGLFKVLVAGQSLLMRLPGNMQNGDVIDLQVVANTPRLTFSISASTNPISTPTEIGSAARLLSDLTQLPLEKTLIKQTGSNAVWQPTSGQVPDTKQLAGALREALANSGLFYESHQAQWVRGERSTAQLLIEPQNQLTGKPPTALGIEQSRQPQPDNLNSTQTSTQTSAQASTQTSAQASTQTSTQASAQAGTQTGTLASAQTDTQAVKLLAESSSPIAKELVPLVQQQLHTLDTHQLAWVGQVWPGQEMQWEIQGQPEKHAAPQDERQWSTEMELALPKLGDVHARLVFSNGGVKLTLHAADSTTVTLFNRSLTRLKIALSDINIPLTATAVEKS